MRFFDEGLFFPGLGPVILVLRPFLLELGDTIRVFEGSRNFVAAGGTFDEEGVERVNDFF